MYVWGRQWSRARQVLSAFLKKYPDSPYRNTIEEVYYPRIRQGIDGGKTLPGKGNPPERKRRQEP
jgi:hypothetical protein